MIVLLRAIAQPFPLILIVLGYGLFRLWRAAPEQRGRLRLVARCYLLLVFLSLPVVGWLALASLEWQHTPCPERPRDIGAIVILGSSVFDPGPVMRRAELDGYSLERVRQGAGLYLQGSPCLVIVSGGKPEPDRPVPSVAEAMERELIRLGVRRQDILVEDQSRTTWENAVESARLLEERGIHRIVLVTDSQHMPRAFAAFRRLGLDVVASACRHRTLGWTPRLTDFFPSVQALGEVHEAVQEWWMRGVYWLRGRG